mgnify:CR=1 FL=1
MKKGKNISEAKTDSQKIAQNQLEIHNLKHLFNDLLRYFQTFVEFTGNEKKFKEYVEGDKNA